jgi:hypothetical protein
MSRYSKVFVSKAGKKAVRHEFSWLSDLLETKKSHPRMVTDEDAVSAGATR